MEQGNLSIEDKVIALLRNTSLSKSEIARQCGVTRGSVQYWGRTGKISKDNLRKLCDVLDCDLANFFYADEQMMYLKPLQEKAIFLIKNLPDEHYYKLEDVIRFLDSTD